MKSGFSKLVFLIIGLSIFYTYVGIYFLPQSESLPPKVIEIKEGIELDELLKIGEEILCVHRDRVRRLRLGRLLGHRAVMCRDCGVDRAGFRLVEVGKAGLGFHELGDLGIVAGRGRL